MNNPYDSSSKNQAEKAKFLLLHYLQVASGRNYHYIGNPFNDENTAVEVGKIVDYILQVAQQQAQNTAQKAIQAKEESVSIKSHNRLQRQLESAKQDNQKYIKLLKRVKNLLGDINNHHPMSKRLTAETKDVVNKIDSLIKK